ncbi:3-oxo-5-alpha-steroid 4-dehydrogenase 1 isoform X3 [Bubalus kerabau]|uniref:3-oxo-5-alpha-steroid 4-dehydrogenase 1 isoform X1 n=1 Tax=Bubalus bubalis TaxID=89462 RepID=UPI00042CDD4C|nr:3-oxo-5-alpha-steroid 4-dehydrogenase 1 isoform X1 [Bubalus bubalis]XP_044788575.1 3-oxo-5-alpha-steroid 4-dehydrogenase 1 isoform X1 [Bubalus bubalis]XP_055410760.1 3-oxo-5-alpha-steroid 4-dehydrogenase 1 isoform X3 [Bubalus carabanensis]
MELAERFLLDALAYLECALGVVCYVLLKLVGSPYGRYASSGSAFGLPARAAWAVQELPSLALPLLACVGAGAPAERLNRWPNCILLAMFLVHYAQRTLVFPFLIRGGKPMPLYAFLLAFIFCTYNGYLQSRYLSQYAVYADDWLSDPRFLTGSALWLIGMLINIHSDHVLRNLRKPGETGYKIPRGGFFEYISAANYFGEVVEWCGYALASWSIQGWAFAVFSFCVLFTRAQQHHKWYHEKFEDYPKFRKIMIPFLV